MKELEVQFRPDTGKAVVEGKTVVPFQALVTLILQRKVQLLFKQWGKEPVIVASELLTSLASVGPKRQLMRQLQRYTVTIHQRVATRMLEEGSLTLLPAVPGLYAQIDVEGLYDDIRGLHIQDIPYNPNMVT